MEMNAPPHIQTYIFKKSIDFFANLGKLKRIPWQFPSCGVESKGVFLPRNVPPSTICIIYISCIIGNQINPFRSKVPLSFPAFWASIVLRK